MPANASSTASTHACVHVRTCSARTAPPPSDAPRPGGSSPKRRVRRVAAGTGGRDGFRFWALVCETRSVGCQPGRRRGCMRRVGALAGGLRRPKLLARRVGARRRGLDGRGARGDGAPGPSRVGCRLALFQQQVGILGARVAKRSAQMCPGRRHHRCAGGQAHGPVGFRCFGPMAGGPQVPSRSARPDGPAVAPPHDRQAGREIDAPVSESSAWASVWAPGLPRLVSLGPGPRGGCADPIASLGRLRAVAP